MTLDLQRCHPYFSAALFENKGDGVDVDCEALRKAIAKKLREATKSDVEREAVEKRTVSTAATIMNTDGVEFGAIHVEETRTPGWYDGTGVKDHLHHLLVVATKGSLMLITATDTGLRDRVVAWTVDAKHGALKDMQAMRRGEIATAFVGTSLKTVWLSATHRRVAVKPDAKVLSGVELEAAFDPLDDQSFSYTSIRTPALGDGQVIGANPSKARLWIGPSRTWDAYTAQVASVLRRVEEVREDAAKGFGGVPVLAEPLDGLDEVGEPYDMTVIVPELLTADYQGFADDPWRAEFADAASFEILDGDDGSDFAVRVHWGEQVYGVLQYSFSARARGGVKLAVKKASWNDELAHADEVLEFCKDADHLTVYYDSGHTFCRGAFFRTRFRDMALPEEHWRWAQLADFAVEREKPLDGKKLDIDRIGRDDDDSLFGFVAKRWPAVETDDPPSGWLLSDDGSMESADFVHLDEQRKKLALIHVKGSSSDKQDRSISVTDFEVVVGQAVKNLRHHDRVNLHEKLSGNADAKIASAVWHDGARQNDRTGFLAALEACGEDLERCVVVFQPRVRKAKLEDLRDRIAAGESPNTDNHVRRLRQLDTLLLAARADCYKLGASFEVVGSADA